jgi:MinD-like ATPase involved in chromosome partitioning or flagellar assembly
MSRIVCVHSFRGGTGKSNTTANLAATIARQGRRVGIVDTDILRWTPLSRQNFDLF